MGLHVELESSHKYPPPSFLDHENQIRHTLGGHMPYPIPTPIGCMDHSLSKGHIVLKGQPNTSSLLNIPHMRHPYINLGSMHYLRGIGLPGLELTHATMPWNKPRLLLDVRTQDCPHKKKLPANKGHPKDSGSKHHTIAFGTRVRKWAVYGPFGRSKGT